MVWYAIIAKVHAAMPAKEISNGVKKVPDNLFEDPKVGVSMVHPLVWGFPKKSTLEIRSLWNLFWAICKILVPVNCWIGD